MVSNVPKEELLSAGLMIGKFTKSGKFRLNISCLDYLSKFCKNKIWVKSGG
jgi:60S ribosome subunit biogenesis protein NIP7